MKNGCVYWVTGLAGAGKTTIGTALYYKLKEKYSNVVLLDGDMLKELFHNDSAEQYTEKARRLRAQKYADLCKLLADQGMIVICCTIAMYDQVREWNRANNENYIEIFLDVPIDILRLRDKKGLYSGYAAGKEMQVAGLDVKIEFPQNADLVICNDGKYTIAECVGSILALSPKTRNFKIDDVHYWNSYYKADKAPKEPSTFAKYVAENYDLRNGRLLELGCGNGRDSLFFQRIGTEVIAIDNSEEIIHELREVNRDKDILFVCDDFTKTNALFRQQFDFCYSRFTLHAISAEQEKQVIRNVYQSLKPSKNRGYFFIEVRSVNDDIYGKGKQVGVDSYIYEGHFRRFVRRDELENRLRGEGFQIVLSEEERNFAVYGEQNPPIIRIIARKER